MAASTANAERGRARLFSLGGFAAAIASAFVSIGSSAHLADTVRVRWTVGPYHHYGPEHLSTLPVLVAFPVIVAGLYVGSRWLGAHLERSGEFDDAGELRTIYEVCVLSTLGTVVATQLVVVALNL